MINESDCQFMLNGIFRPTRDGATATSVTVCSLQVLNKVVYVLYRPWGSRSPKKLSATRFLKRFPHYAGHYQRPKA